MGELRMPRLSDSMEEGTIVRWLVPDGAEVAAGAELVEIETDKATMVYEADAAGVLEVIAGAGDTVAVGAPIARIDGIEAAAASKPAGRQAALVATGNTDGRRVAASPLARRMAAGLGIAISTLEGTGPGGRVIKRDVLRGAATAPPPPSPPSGGVPQAAATGGAKGRVTVREPSVTQATIARRMSEAASTIPEFTLEVEVDMDPVATMREEFTSMQLPACPSINDFVIRACALALRAHPQVNGAYREGRFELYERINVGVAVAAPGSLLVATVYDADRRSLIDLAGETRRLVQAARAGMLSPEQLTGGTFTVSNLGMFGIARFTAVLNPPQAAILAVGAVQRRPVERDGALAFGHRMSLTLTCDHRILYGADAAAFIATIRANLEAPLRLAL